MPHYEPPAPYIVVKRHRSFDPSQRKRDALNWRYKFANLALATRGSTWGVLDILVQSRRNAKAAKRLLRMLLKKQGIAPRFMIRDKLASYGVDKREIMLGIEHRQHRGLNNRGENSYQLTRRRERFMLAEQTQRFLSAHDQVANLFRYPANANAAERLEAPACLHCIG